MKNVLFIVAVFLTGSVIAQAANPRYNCTTSCTFVTDIYLSSGPLPTSCKLYSAGVVKVSAPAVTVSTGKQCQVPATFAVGTYSVTMSAVDSAGVETAQSTPFAFDSSVPVPPLTPPVNLRILGTPF